MVKKVIYMKKEHKVYLDNLKESRATNMFGASSYLMDKFDFDKSKARKILSEWMKSYGQEIEYGEEE